MSEPDKKSGSGAEGSAVVLVEQSATSRHKQPFRSSELQEESADLHHKRSKAPAVPSSVVEEFKDTNVENKDRRLKDNVSSERSHTSAAKKLSHIKKRDSSPETITLAAIDKESKVGTKSPMQLIPAQLSEASTLSDISIDKIGSDKKDDDDITEEIAEMQSPESTNRAGWGNRADYKRKDISLHQEIFNGINNNDPHTNSSWKLQRTASVGPCFYPVTPSGKPSGIAISIPKKSIRSVRELYEEGQSTISISIAKKWQPYNFKALVIDEVQTKENTKSTTFFGSLKQKISNVGETIKNCF